VCIQLLLMRLRSRPRPHSTHSRIYTSRWWFIESHGPHDVVLQRRSIDDRRCLLGEFPWRCTEHSLSQRYASSTTVTVSGPLTSGGFPSHGAFVLSLSFGFNSQNEVTLYTRRFGFGYWDALYETPQCDRPTADAIFLPDTTNPSTRRSTKQPHTEAPWSPSTSMKMTMSGTRSAS
jgi:hypothetical protein